MPAQIYKKQSEIHNTRQHISAAENNSRIGRKKRNVRECHTKAFPPHAGSGKRTPATRSGYWCSGRSRSPTTFTEECGVTGSRIMGGGFGGCTINLVKDELYDNFIATAKKRFNEKYGHEPKVYEVVISDGSRRLE